MFKYTGKIAISFLAAAPFFLNFPLSAQSNKNAAGNITPMTAEKAIDLAQSGLCKEALPALKRALSGAGPADMRKQAGVAGLRCALTMDDREASIDFLRQLQKVFPKDPDVLFVVVHAYSDLSTRAAEDLARTAPQSIPAHKLNAEALEMQGKWDSAELEYDGIVEKYPSAPGIHFLLGRLLLSRPDADAKATERAKEEFLKELVIDPRNAGANYILGELARQDQNWEEAIVRFSRAAKLDPTFADAYLAWGSCLVSVKRYEEAIAPLREAKRLTPGNPAVHYALATALSRLGHKEEADQEFAIQRNLESANPATRGPQNPQ
jgi:tetratricopeptide (TPR) repeat protein